MFRIMPCLYSLDFIWLRLFNVLGNNIFNIIYWKHIFCIGNCVQSSLLFQLGTVSITIDFLIVRMTRLLRLSTTNLTYSRDYRMAFSCLSLSLSPFLCTCQIERRISLAGEESSMVMGKGRGRGSGPNPVVLVEEPMPSEREIRVPSSCVLHGAS